jgi:hypothetical protein
MGRALSVACFGVAVLVLASGAVKALDLRLFEQVLGTWSTLPGWAASGLTIVVPTVELALAAWMLGAWGDWRPRAVIAAMLVVYAVAVGVELHRSGEVACGCTGRVEDTVSQAWVIGLRNGLLAVVLVADAVRRRRRAA